MRNTVQDIIAQILIFVQLPPPEKKQRKETLLSAELGKYVDKKVRVKFQGGREGKFKVVASSPGPFLMRRGPGTHCMRMC